MLCCVVLGFEGNSPHLFILRLLFCFSQSIFSKSISSFPLSPHTTHLVPLLNLIIRNLACIPVSYRLRNYESSNRARFSVVLFYPSSPTIYRPQFVFVVGAINLCFLCMVKAQFEMHTNGPIQRGWQGVESSLQARQTSSSDSNNGGGSSNTVVFIVSF